MRLFSAVLPPRFAVEDLAERVDAIRTGDARLRFTGPERWHVTLRFYGDDEPAARAEWLAERLAGVAAPRLRIAGAGTFPGVFFAGVQARRPARLRALARACGADRDYRAHVTLARWRDPAVPRARLAALLDGYAGPWFPAAEVALVASADGEYTVLQRFDLLGGG